MKTKEQIVNETCLAYLVKHLPKELETYKRLCKNDYSNNSYTNNHPCEGVQWKLVTHMICVFKTLTTFNTDAYSEHEYLFDMIDKFEKENKHV